MRKRYQKDMHFKEQKKASMKISMRKRYQKDMHFKEKKRLL